MSTDCRNSIAYLRERIVNAWWMIREGRFRLLVASAWQELNQRVNDLRPAQQALPRESSNRLNPSLLQPPSPRPTRYRIDEDGKHAQEPQDELRPVLARFSGSQPQPQPGQGE